ncbi:hypothetical protein WQE_05107 [Paraburkholderia hospita]|uniref:DUF2474 domain-containing protein n=1 Tax=Paraburkholderia hospita TaxID=169430 RepID=A0ABP2PWJ4_9BURK|nr:DUF2474 domain-containing protein [Paraburkholderia hospita]EIN02186.1 hypothetical protein WQE_05107 [Paraburkholderia hospita]OUL90147.1 DUF2474 domain-containing protein [Paraburkholderia hospita]
MNRASTHRDRADGGTLKRLGWLILIWVCSVAALGVFALGMRIVMSLVGMTR